MSGFQFKQFSVAHDRCAMKVGTDSIALGSWAQPKDATRMLDIGCGSGLLALMLAQKAASNAQIIGVELDSAAAQQAGENVANSPWATQITVLQQDILSYHADPQFDLIISNPPYFTPWPAQRESARQLAREQSKLTLTTLLGKIAELLAANGQAYLVLPAGQFMQVQQVSEKQGLFVSDVLQLCPSPSKPPLRCLLELSREPSEYARKPLVIRDASGEYSTEYQALCRDYYLRF